MMTANALSTAVITKCYGLREWGEPVTVVGQIVNGNYYYSTDAHVV